MKKKFESDLNYQKSIFKILITSIFITTFLLASINKEIAMKSYKITSRFESSQSNMTMTLINARYQKTRK
jgi:hypothetical protein